MKVVCKSATMLGRMIGDNYANLTIGKIYTINDSYEHLILLVDDAGQSCWYPQKNFDMIDKIREQKLIKLGI